MSYESKPLPFNSELIGISKNTIEIHHDKLYQGYVNKMNSIGEALSDIAHKRVEADANQTQSTLRGLRLGETFAANGTYLHEYYFNVLGGKGGSPENPLTKAIIEKWGSMENFVDFFSASAMSVRGWVVLSWDVQKERLKIYGADSHNHGAVWGCIPLIVLDVYEHAYFIDYGADRKAYISDFWKNMNWEAANHLYEKVNGWSLT